MEVSCHEPLSVGPGGVACKTKSSKRIARHDGVKPGRGRWLVRASLEQRQGFPRARVMGPGAGPRSRRADYIVA